ncbi:hypothetical protein [Pseudorhodoferax sp.]|uniref:hypothetical protein n=1 Tax=Pseudorhodoferax sp. TaxID=1993553 RepID=UPI002DD660F9|nr:hypothetical protein [Pseudorhodoferax sp.]
MAAHDSPSSAPRHADEEYGMPCAEALLAGALALMTGHAQACCAGQRDLMARKVADNLQLLARHPSLSAEFRSMLVQLQRRWSEQDRGAEGLVRLPPQALWHKAPEGLQ